MRPLSRLAGRLVAGAALAGLGAGAVVPQALTLSVHAATQRLMGPVVGARGDAPVVITGAQVPAWSRSPAVGSAAPYPSGVSKSYPGGDGARTAHNGVLTVPPDARTGVNPDDIAAYSWDGTAWVEVPVQVDKKFQHFLANGHSSFSVYSGTDPEVTYAWNPTRHTVGEEAWKKVFGQCSARYALNQAEVQAAIQAGQVSPSSQAPLDDYTKAMADPVAGLTTLDEIAMQAGDAGVMAPPGTATPSGTDASSTQVVTVVDPLNPAATGYIYLFLKPGAGSSFNSGNGYVRMARDANADEWIDRYTYAPSSYDKIGTSNTSYGPNIPGTVCRTDPGNDANPHIATPDGQPRPSIDRVPRDGTTVTTDRYRVKATGRWLVKDYRVAAPGQPGDPADPRPTTRGPTW